MRENHQHGGKSERSSKEATIPEDEEEPTQEESQQNGREHIDEHEQQAGEVIQAQTAKEADMDSKQNEDEADDERVDTNSDAELKNGGTSVGGNMSITHHESVEPENFDTKSFLSGLSDIHEQLKAESFNRVDNDFPADSLEKLVSSMNGSMNNFKQYSMRSQQQLQQMREQMKSIKDKIYKKIQLNKGYEREHRGSRVSLEERELEAKLAQLNKEIAHVGEELVRAAQVTLETEQAAVEASLVAQQAADDAKQMQEEYEANRRAEHEARRAEEERREAEEARRAEAEARTERERKAEEARLTKLRKHDTSERRETGWESWPVYTYETKAGHFDQGIGCIIRADPSTFREDAVTCEVLSQLDTTFSYNENEELVANIIRLSSTDDGEFKYPVMVAIPHCMARASAYSREAVVKAETRSGVWEELKSAEVHMDGHRDLKFVQAEVKSPCCLTVVSRFKRDFLHFLKRGGRVQSSVDHRIIFSTERGTFTKTEHFVLQMQPVDSASVADIKNKTPEGKGLLTSSSIVTLEWSSHAFQCPVVMSLPIPPNPIKAQKAAAARAAKEEKRKNPQTPAMALEEDEMEKKRRRLKKAIAQAQKQIADENDPPPRPKSTRWYMGQYGNNDEDEHDNLYFVKKQKSGKWHVVEGISIKQIKLDMVEFTMKEPQNRFIILRTRTAVESTEAQKMAEVIEHHLSQRGVYSIVKQNHEDLQEVAVNMVHYQKADKAIKQLEEDGFTEGPGMSKELTLKEGDKIEIGLRGNLKLDHDGDSHMVMVFNSQLTNTMNLHITEVDKFLQKSYNVYRGFVQIIKVVTVIHKPSKIQLEDNPEAQPVIEYKRHLLSEHLVSIPKDHEAFAAKPVVKAPLRIRNVDDCLDESTLRIIADNLGDEWQRVAHYLNVKKVRLQAIMRNNLYKDEGDTTKFDMLLSWVKKIPLGGNRVEALSNALIWSGRADLSKELSILQEEFRDRKKKEA